MRNNLALSKKYIPYIKILPLSILLFTTIFCLSSPTAEAKVTRYLTGNAGDVTPTLFGPVLDLGGGGTDVDQAFQAMFDKVRGCTNCATKIDVVILRSTGADG